MSGFFSGSNSFGWQNPLATGRNIGNTNLRTPSCTLTNVNTQSIPDTTKTYLTFDTVVLNSYGLFNPAQPDRITIKTAGVYVVVAFVPWAANATGNRISTISGQTSAAVEIAAVADTRTAVNGSNTNVSISSFFRLMIGNIVRMPVVQTSGGALLVTAPSPAIAFGIQWISAL